MIWKRRTSSSTKNARYEKSCPIPSAISALLVTAALVFSPVLVTGLLPSSRRSLLLPLRRIRSNAVTIHSRRTCSIICWSSSSNDGGDTTQDNTANQHSNSNSDANTDTLYDILGVSPTATTGELKFKYQQLARQLHPDARINNNNKDADHKYDFSDVAQAWKILSDSKQRLRYDRELKRQQLTDDFEVLLDEGIRNAIPFFRKTAQNLQVTAKNFADVSEQSSRVLNDVNERMRVAAKVQALLDKRRELQQQSTRATKRAEQIQRELDTQTERCIASLRNPKAKLSSADALRILQTFNITAEEKPIKEVDALQAFEAEQRDKQRQHQTRERNLQAIERQAVEAMAAEKRAAERLLAAQLALEQAQQQYQDVALAKIDAVQQLKLAAGEWQSVDVRLEQQTERLRAELRANEQASMERQAAKLRAERLQAEELARQLLAQAKQVQEEARAVQLEQELRERQRQQEETATAVTQEENNTQEQP